MCSVLKKFKTVRIKINIPDKLRVISTQPCSLTTLKSMDWCCSDTFAFSPDKSEGGCRDCNKKSGG